MTIQRTMPVLRIEEDGTKILFTQEDRLKHKDHFELSYMRWRYFIKSPNPPKNLLNKYEPLVNRLSRQVFGRFRPMFKLACMDIEDIQSVGMVQLVSYLGLFSIEYNEENYNKFIKDYISKAGRKPFDDEIRKKDISNMAAFISQRLLDLARVCHQKNRRTAGDNITYQMFLLVKEEKPCSDSDLMLNPELYGFKKINRVDMTKIRRGRKRKFMGSERFEHEGKIYRLVYETNPRVNIDGFNSDEMEILNPQEDHVITHQTMEDLYFREKIETLSDKFKAMPKQRKKTFLRRAIKRLSKKPNMKKELELANNMLLKLR